ncbi:hypothetical protein ACFLZV_06645 [Candidatus Margulisiibacteriota bacterium]
MKKRDYYSERNNKDKISLEDLCYRFGHLYLFFRKKDYFKQKADITSNYFPDEITHEAVISINFQPFPINQHSSFNENQLFDVIEFLYDHISKPGKLVDCIENGFNYQDYRDYDEAKGKEKYRDCINPLLARYRSGYELNKDGCILARCSDGTEEIINADIPKYDENNIDIRVREAIIKWRNRSLSISEKKDAIVELANIFEWLKKSGKLKKVLLKKDESAIFEIANNFCIRHHNPSQKQEYDKDIWNSWIFHIFLATYHATIRLIKRQEKNSD